MSCWAAAITAAALGCTAVAGETIQLDEQLSLHTPAGLMLTLCAPCSHQRVNLIQKDGCWGMVARKVEQHLQTDSHSYGWAQCPPCHIAGAGSKLTL